MAKGEGTAGRAGQVTGENRAGSMRWLQGNRAARILTVMRMYNTSLRNAMSNRWGVGEGDIGISYRLSHERGRTAAVADFFLRDSLTATFYGDELADRVLIHTSYNGPGEARRYNEQYLRIVNSPGF